MSGLDVTLKIRLSADERALLERIAGRERRSMSSVARYAIVRYCTSLTAGETVKLAPGEHDPRD